SEQETAYEIGGGQPRLCQAVLDAGGDTLGQLPRMADEIGTADRGVEAGHDPFQRDVGPALVRQSDLGFLYFHRQRMAALLLDHAHQAVERSEEHTSELQSRSDLVCRLLLEK